MSEQLAGESSMVGRLLQEVSWERAGSYRAGGRGRENVLTAEVLMALDFLPRKHFLGAVIDAAHGAEEARTVLVSDVENASMSFLPGDLPLAPESATASHRNVQPDAVVTSPRSFLLLEAKRIRSNSFQLAQLAREYVAVMAHTSGKAPLVLLMGATPPLLVAGHGRMTIRDAVTDQLESVLDETGNSQMDLDVLLSRIDDVFCWISWDEVAEVVSRQATDFVSADPSVTASVLRLAASITDAVTWHA